MITFYSLPFKVCRVLGREPLVIACLLNRAAVTQFLDVREIVIKIDLAIGGEIIKASLHKKRPLKATRYYSMIGILYHEMVNHIK